MRFGPVDLDAAEGAILAHSVQVPGGKLKKGMTLAAKDVAALRDAGRSTVIVARLDEGDIGEDAAATRLANALVPDPDAVGLRLGRAATGRVNVYATGPGVLDFDAKMLTALNGINPMVTLATLQPRRRVADRAMCATIKIITYAVPEADIQGFENLAASAAFRRAAPVLRRARLIETRLPGQKDAPKGRAAVQARLDRLGVALAPREVVAHDKMALSEALSATDAPADLLLILTGSATSDPDDIGPGAVRASGGKVDRFGMPVDPGNLLFLGRLHHVPVVGLPGCARSIALNGADWVLERLICGIEVTGDDIAGMAVGGLLKEPPDRPSPRASVAPEDDG